MKQTPSDNARLAALLDAMIDGELKRPDAEQDMDAVREWSDLIDRLNSGADRPDQATKRAALRTLRGQSRTSGFRRRIAIPAACVLAAVLLAGSAYAAHERDRLDELLLSLRSRLNAMEEGETLTVRDGDREIYIYNGEAVRYKSPAELARARGKAVLWPSQLPAGIEAGPISRVPDFANTTLIPYTDGFAFSLWDEDRIGPYPETTVVTVCGEETDFCYYLSKGGGGGWFRWKGDIYELVFRSLDEAEAFIGLLTEIEG